MKSSRRSLFRLLGVGVAGAALARFLPTAEAKPVATFPPTPELDALTKKALDSGQCPAVVREDSAFVERGGVILVPRPHMAEFVGERCRLEAGHAEPYHDTIIQRPGGIYDFFRWNK